MERYICVTCGTQYPESEHLPKACPICTDDRQYLPPGGQQWTTLAALHGHHTNAFTELAPGITTISTEPKVGIGQRAYLIQGPAGNVLWDCIAYLDDAAIDGIQRRGDVQAIAISHPHFFTTMLEWSAALGDVPIYLHADLRPWVMRSGSAVHFWDGERYELAPGLALVRCGGHFPGSTVLYREGANGGPGALFTGDTIKVVADRRYVTFMYSYPNDIPLDASTIQHIAASVAPLDFDRLYDGWTEVAGDAKASVMRSADRYIAHLRGEQAT